MLVSFQRRALAEARARRPGIRTVQHVGLGVGLWAAAGAWAVGFRDTRVTARRLEAARALEFETTVYTVNDEERLRELARLGVGGVFTDRPDVARSVLASATS